MSGLAESPPKLNLHTYVDRFKLASTDLAKSLPSESNSTLRQILPELFNDYFQAVNNSNMHLSGYGKTDTWLEIYTQNRGDESGAPIMYALGLLFVNLSLSEWNQLKNPIELQALLVGIENDVYSYHKEPNDDNNLVHFMSTFYDVDKETAFEKVFQIWEEVMTNFNKIQKPFGHVPSFDETSPNLQKHLQFGLPGWLEGGGFWQSSLSQRYVSEKSQDSNAKAFNIFHPEYIPKDPETLLIELINKDILDWISKLELTSPEFPQKKFIALRLGQAVINMYTGYMNGKPISNYQTVLTWIGKFLAWIYIVDDIAENNTSYELIKSAVIESFINQL